MVVGTNGIAVEVGVAGCGRPAARSRAITGLSLSARIATGNRRELTLIGDVHVRAPFVVRSNVIRRLST